ncbi:unnamed protein product [Porites evermanni]|uniref:Sodefrin-like factor n=1 Tax=Porites evermanni TaxID=104178 RepID=A0ABN8MMG2_9CNID|nr:unnamed protein product [Porites evermanni]
MQSSLDVCDNKIQKAHCKTHAPGADRCGIFSFFDGSTGVRVYGKSCVYQRACDDKDYFCRSVRKITLFLSEIGSGFGEANPHQEFPGSAPRTKKQSNDLHCKDPAENMCGLNTYMSDCEVICCNEDLCNAAASSQVVSSLEHSPEVSVYGEDKLKVAVSSAKMSTVVGCDTPLGRSFINTRKNQ